METSTTGSGRSGRRRGASHTREEIAEAARLQFAEAGYERATMRSIAQAAGVDPALIVHFFGNKEALFSEVMALPVDLGQVFASLANVPRDEVGQALARAVVTAFDDPQTRAVLVGRIRSATSHEEAAGLVRGMVARDLQMLTSGLSDDRPDVRALLIGVQVVGLVTVRYVVGVEPLASMAPDEVANLMAPIFQRLLVEPLEDA